MSKGSLIKSVVNCCLIAVVTLFAGCMEKRVVAVPTSASAASSAGPQVAASAVHPASSVQVKIASKDVLHVGVDEQFPPMVFRAANAELIGFDVDMAKEAFKRMGANQKFDFVPVDWMKKDVYLNNEKTVDLLWSGVNISPERQQIFDFSEPYLTNRQVVVVRNDSAIKTLADLSGKKVSVQQGSSLIPKLKAFQGTSGAIGDIIIDREYALAMVDLLNGKADASAMGDVVFKHYNSANPGKFRVLEGDFGVTSMAVAVRKGDTQLLEKINTALAAMKADGTTDRITKKWFAGSS